MAAARDQATCLLFSTISRAILIAAHGLVIAPISCGTADAEKPAKPATVDEVASVIDLTTFPILESVESSPTPRLAALVYRVSGEVKTAFDFQKAKLESLNFKEIPGGHVSDEGANGTFTRDGYVVSVVVSVCEDAPEERLVTLTNHGNVDLSTLPVPEGAENLYTTPLEIAYVTEAAVPETVEAIRKLLIARDWQAYGEPFGNWQEYKQNAVRLSVSVNSDPAQGGRTVVEYRCDLMSADLPISPDFHRALYTDPLKRLVFYTQQSLEDAVEFYRETLGKSGFKPTLDSPGKLDSISYLIFRNAQNEMVTLEMQTMGDGFLRGEVWYHSVREVEEFDRMKRSN